jgi:hypothetical protein
MLLLRMVPTGAGVASLRQAPPGLRRSGESLPVLPREVSRQCRTGRSKPRVRTSRPSQNSQRSGWNSAPITGRRVDVPVRELEQVLQVALGDVEQGRADHRAVERAHAADDDDQQDVDHDVEGQGGAGAVVAQPERVEDAGQGGEQGRQHGGQAAVGDVAVADGLAAEIVVADRHQDAAERRIDDAQHEQEEAARTQHDQVIGDQLAVEIGAEELFVGQGEGRGDELRDLEVEAVLAAGPVGELRSHGHEGSRDGERDHGEKDRPHPQGKQADAQRQNRRQY